jgi:hypothetical protein
MEPAKLKQVPPSTPRPHSQAPSFVGLSPAVAKTLQRLNGGKSPCCGVAFASMSGQCVCACCTIPWPQIVLTELAIYLKDRHSFPLTNEHKEAA